MFIKKTLNYSMFEYSACFGIVLANDVALNKRAYFATRMEVKLTMLQN